MAPNHWSGLPLHAVASAFYESQLGLRRVAGEPEVGDCTYETGAVQAENQLQLVQAPRVA